jgi:glycosyltransferase involved in cell wall biosynthesis
MTASRPRLTLLVPCYEEGARVEGLLAAVDAWARDHEDVSHELLCVDDGSGDDTVERLARAARARPALRVLRLPANRGKGAALRAGVAQARGELVLFLDADLAVDLAHVAPALAALEAGADVVIGCRNVPGAVILRPQGVLRRWLGRAYRRLACAWLGLGVSDVTCGFKAFRAEVARGLFARARCARWGFDAEILYLARRAGLEVGEIPVRWRDGEASAVRLGRDVLRSLRELAAVRWRHRHADAGAPVASPAGVPAGTVQEP